MAFFDPLMMVVVTLLAICAYFVKTAVDAHLANVKRQDEHLRLLLADLAPTMTDEKHKRKNDYVTASDGTVLTLVGPDADLAAGRLTTYDSMQDFIDDL